MPEESQPCLTKLYPVRGWQCYRANDHEERKAGQSPVLVHVLLVIVVLCQVPSDRSDRTA